MSSHTGWALPSLEDDSTFLSFEGSRTEYPEPNVVLKGLTDRRRRRILAVLLDRDSPISEGDLAARIAAEESSDEAVHSVSVDLHHVQLPTLADVGLVERKEADGTVTTTDHPIFEDPTFRRLLETDADVDDLLDCLADERRRIVLAVLDAHEGPMDRADLARRVADREAGDDSEGAVDAVLVSLHHLHLPKLESAGLVRTDPEEGTVYRAQPDGGHERLDR